MARIEQLSRISKERPSLHDPVECSYSVLTIEGSRYLQIDTFGRHDRELPGKVSQSIQMGEDVAAELVSIIRANFPGIEG